MRYRRSDPGVHNVQMDDGDARPSSSGARNARAAWHPKQGWRQKRPTLAIQYAACDNTDSSGGADLPGVITCVRFKTCT